MTTNAPPGDLAFWVFARTYATLAVNYRLQEPGTDRGLESAINRALHDASHMAQGFQRACAAASAPAPAPQAPVYRPVDEASRTPESRWPNGPPPIVQAAPSPPIVQVASVEVPGNGSAA